MLQKENEMAKIAEYRIASLFIYFCRYLPVLRGEKPHTYVASIVFIQIPGASKEQISWWLKAFRSVLLFARISYCC